VKRTIWSVVALSIIASLTIAIEPANAATVYSFTNAGATGPTGPTQTQLNTQYTGGTLSGLVTSSAGIQIWTIPAGKYRFEVYGSSRANNANGVTSGTANGFGAYQVGEFTFASATSLKILVGQTASGNVNGNGGTFVVTSTNSALIVAGGAGGDGPYSTSWRGYQGSVSTGSGAGGTGAQYGAGGGGFTNDGNNGISEATTTKGISFVNGGAGGGSAGFGGGGGGSSTGGGGGGYSGGAGGDYGSGSQSGFGPGYGGLSYNSGSNVSSGIRNTLGPGYVTITSLGPSLTTFAPTTTLTNSTSLTYNVVFSEIVTGLASSDFSKSGTGSSTCGTPTVSGSGTTYTVSLSGCSPGTVILTIASNAATNSSSQSAPPSSTSAATVTIDTTAPTISSVSAPTNKTYIPSETPTFTIAFSESVTVSGNPRLTLTVGSATEYATFLSMTDSKTALFRYTISSDPTEFDSDGIAVATSLDLNGGSFADLATNALTNLAFTAPTLTSVLVAQPAAAPTIDSITATSGTLTVYFTPGAARGSTTSNYQYSTNNGATFKVRETGSTASPLVISTVSTASTNLVNGTSYTIRLRAVTNAGNSDSSTAVTETPTAVSVTGDATLTLTYGSSASTAAYSAAGGTNTFTWSLGSSISGVTLSGTTVTASSALAAGTYTQTLRATDGNSQVGTKVLTITVNKASTSISITLPNSATTAAASGTVTITATVPRAGSVNFKLGGTTISGCGSQAAASTTATCSWTAPGTLGSVTLTADFTPTDSANYETSTTTNLTISIVNGVSTVTLSLAGGVTQTPKGQTVVITAAIDQAGKVSFYADGKRIPGCYNKSAIAGNKTCSWKPATQKQVTITVTLNPTNNVYQSSSQSMKVWVIRRAGLR
jgi:hypothetical protein